MPLLSARRIKSYRQPNMFSRAFLAAAVAMSAIAPSDAFAPTAVARVGAARNLPLRSSAPRGFRLPGTEPLQRPAAAPSTCPHPNRTTRPALQRRVHLRTPAAAAPAGWCSRRHPASGAEIATD